MAADDFIDSNGDERMGYSYKVNMVNFMTNLILMRFIVQTEH